MESPRTLSLEAAEWSALTMFCVNSIGAALQQIAQQNQGMIDDNSALQLKIGLERANQLVEAWRRTSQQAILRNQPQQVQQPQSPHTPHRQSDNLQVSQAQALAMTNGPAEPPKKRAGWPKGKPRKSQETQQPN